MILAFAFAIVAAGFLGTLTVASRS